MKKLLILALLHTSLNLFSQTSPYVNSRGCVVCDMLSVADTFSLNGAIYTVVDRSLLNTMRDNGSDLSKVCVSLVTEMTSLFENRTWFNQDIGSWDVSSVTDMGYMFAYASTFNQDCLLYTSPSPRDRTRSRMPSSA